MTFQLQEFSHRCQSSLDTRAVWRFCPEWRDQGPGTGVEVERGNDFPPFGSIRRGFLEEEIFLG